MNRATTSEKVIAKLINIFNKILPREKGRTWIDRTNYLSLLALYSASTHSAVMIRFLRLAATRYFLLPTSPATRWVTVSQKSLLTSPIMYCILACNKSYNHKYKFTWSFKPHGVFTLKESKTETDKYQNEYITHWHQCLGAIWTPTQLYTSNFFIGVNAPLLTCGIYVTIKVQHQLRWLWEEMGLEPYYLQFCFWQEDVRVWATRCLHLFQPWHLWFNHTSCLLDREWDWDMDECVVRFYVQPFTLHLNRDRGRRYCPPLFWLWS